HRLGEQLLPGQAEPLADLRGRERGQPERLQPVPGVRAQTRAYQPVQLRVRRLRADHPAQIRPQPAHRRTAAQVGRVGCGPEGSGADPLGHGPYQPPPRRVRQLHPPTAHSPASLARMSARRTCMIRWITVITDNTASSHSAAGRAQPTPRPVTSAPIPITSSRSARSAIPTSQSMPRLCARAFTYEMTCEATRHTRVTTRVGVSPTPAYQYATAPSTAPSAIRSMVESRNAPNRVL